MSGPQTSSFHPYLPEDGAKAIELSKMAGFFSFKLVPNAVLMFSTKALQSILSTQTLSPRESSIYTLERESYSKMH